MKITVKEAKRRLEVIDEEAWDDEAAHSDEDKLFHEFVNDIANRKYATRKEIIEVAQEVIKSLDIDFCRWTS
jgi:hypothetical protein